MSSNHDQVTELRSEYNITVHTFTLPLCMSDFIRQAADDPILCLLSVSNVRPSFYLRRIVKQLLQIMIRVYTITSFL
jgi:hypothetical protein